MTNPFHLLGAFLRRFFGWSRRTLDTICDRPDHLQRLAVIGSGVVMYPTFLAMVLIVWKGFGQHEALMPQQLNILGNTLLGVLALLALVVIALLGIIRGLRIQAPGGLGVDIETTSGMGGGGVTDLHLHHEDPAPPCETPRAIPPAPDARAFMFLLHLLLHPYVLVGLIVLGAIAVGAYYFLGPVRFAQIACDVRTWFAVFMVVAVLGYANVEKQNADLKAGYERATAAAEQTATVDTAKTVKLRTVQVAARKVQTHHHQEIISHAPPGQALDSLLDAFAADRPDLGPAPQPHDRLHKQPDGVVEP